MRIWRGAAATPICGGAGPRTGSARVPSVRLGKRELKLPRSRAARIGIGAALVLGGVVGFLPILGFWMVPLGLAVLSVDVPAVRRLRRRVELWGRRRLEAWRRRRNGGGG